MKLEFRLAEAWAARAAELGAAADRPARLLDLTPQQRARLLLDQPYPHGGSCPCFDCVTRATLLLDELLPGWQDNYRRGRRQLERL